MRRKGACKVKNGGVYVVITVIIVRVKMMQSGA